MLLRPRGLEPARIAGWPSNCVDRRKAGRLPPAEPGGIELSTLTSRRHLRPADPEVHVRGAWLLNPAHDVAVRRAEVGRCRGDGGAAPLLRPAWLGLRERPCRRCRGRLVGVPSRQEGPDVVSRTGGSAGIGWSRCAAPRDERNLPLSEPRPTPCRPSSETFRGHYAGGERCQCPNPPDAARKHDRDRHRRTDEVRHRAGPRARGARRRPGDSTVKCPGPGFRPLTANTMFAWSSVVSPRFVNRS